MKLNKSLAVLFTSIYSFVLHCPSTLSQADSTTLVPASSLISAVDSGTILREPDNTSPFTNKPISPENTNDTRPETAPGADAVMTPSLLLVSPLSKGAPEVSEPLRAFIGQSLTLKVEDSNITIGTMQGVMVSVVNDTSRPLVLDGDNAKAIGGEQSCACAPLIALQQSVLPKHGGKTIAAEVFTKLIPAAVSVGLVPTVQDAILIRKPVRQRYGPDERRRLIEASRFGKRILWPHQQTKGVIYFQNVDTLAGSKIQIAVHTLFDIPDCTTISSGAI